MAIVDANQGFEPQATNTTFVLALALVVASVADIALARVTTLEIDVAPALAHAIAPALAPDRAPDPGTS